MLVAGLGIIVLGSLTESSGAVAATSGARADMSLAQPVAAADLQLAPGGAAVADSLAHYTSALQFESAGKLREALDHYLKAFEADPANPELSMHTAELAYSFQGREAAVELLDKALKFNPNDPAPYINLARFCATYASDDPFSKDRVTEVLEEALKRFPKTAHVYGAATLMYLARGARDAAVKALEQAAKQDVPDPQFWLSVGRAAQQVWPLGQAEVRTEHTGRVNPYFENALRRAAGARAEAVKLDVAQFFLLTNQLERARDLCEKVVAEHGSLQARKLLHRLYDAFDQKDKALATLEKIVEEAPADVEQRKLLASTYETRQEFDKAIPHREAAIKIGGGQAEDYLELGELLLGTRNFEKLVHLAQRSIQLFPENAMFHVQAALAYRSLQQWDKAIDAFAEAAELAETTQSEVLNHRFYFQYGITLERGGRHDEAGRIFEKSITLTPKEDLEDAASTMNYLGYMWLELDRHLDKAGELIQKANELQPGNAAYIDSLGWWHYKKGEYAKALADLQHAESLIKDPQPDDAEIIQHIAEAYVKLGDKAKAREYFTKASALQPTDPKVKKRIEDGLKTVGE